MNTLSELPFVTPEDIGERAMEAMRGGRQITGYLNYLDEHNRARISGKFGQEEVNRVWRGAIDPAIGWESWARTGDSYRPGMDLRRNIGLTLAQAEGMLDWPIYRAAILQAALEPILYVDGPDTQWSPDTLDAIGQLVPAPRITRMVAKTTDQGTAASETALCNIHDTPTNRGTFGLAADTDVDGLWVDASDNEALECQVCGATVA